MALRPVFIMPDFAPDLFQTRARGKLLLTGEYFVLDGAVALALPVRYGQTLRIGSGATPGRLSWTAKNHDGAIWFRAEFELPGLHILTATDAKTAAQLQRILLACRAQAPAFLADRTGVKALTQNDFPREWGLGTSSTLVAALARWAGVDPYPVLFDTLGGSGYDLACAYADGPILYSRNGRQPQVQPVGFQPPFADQLYFIFLGKKQDSSVAIQRYRDKARHDRAGVLAITQLTERFLAAGSLSELEQVLREHETVVGRALDLPRAKDLYFSTYWGEVKSLGAWGGDFVLATSDRSEAETRAFFNEKGFPVFMAWREMTG